MEKARTIGLWLLIVSAAAVGAEPAGRPDKSVMVMFQDAQYQEQTAGDLDKAIELYQQVVQEAGEVEKLAARATFQLGMCYLKKGDKEKAAEYFDNVILKFSGQTEIVRLAKIEHEKIRPSIAVDQDIQNQLVAYLFDLQRKTYFQGKTEGISSHTQVCIVDETFTSISGALITIENNSAQPMKNEISICNSGNVDFELYDDTLTQQKFRYENSGSTTGQYRLIWQPEKPLMPGEVKVLGFRNILPDTMPKSSGRYELVMNNYFGPAVIENFVAVVPATIEITEGASDVWTHQRMGGFDVYVWQKRIPANTTAEKKLALKTRETFPDSSKPAVIDSYPATYANDVDPALGEISVTFDQDMNPTSWAWCRTGSPEIYPQVTKQPFYKDKRTCVLPIKIEPARSYLVLINLAPYEGFKNTDMIPAMPYAIVFATKDAGGNPTEIQRDLFEKAQEINTQYALPQPLLDTIPPAVKTVLANMFEETYKRAKTKGLHTNSHVHIIDKDFNRTMGGIDIFENKTNQTIDKETALNRFDGHELYMFDNEGVRQKTRMVKIPGSNYRLFWTPSSPVASQETRTLIWMGAGASKMAADENQKYRLVMGNHFGSPVIEDFYVVLPSSIQISSQTTDYTSHQTVEGFDIYCWSQEQERNVNHHVEITLEKAEVNEQTAEVYKQKLEQPVTVNISQSPDGDKLTLQYAAMAIAEAAGVPYQWDKSAKLADPQRRNYIDPVHIDGKIASQALTELLSQAGLSYCVDIDGIYLYSQEKLKEIVEDAVLVISTCTETDPKVKKSLDSLKEIDPNTVVKELCNYLDSETATVRRSAIFILWRGEFPDISAAREKLIALCGHSENYTRGMAAIALGAGKVPAAYDVLVKMTTNDTDGYARRCGAYALGLFGDQKALPILEQALKDNEDMVKQNAQAAITMLTKLNGTKSKDMEPGVSSEKSEAIQKAVDAAKGWLALLDNGQYAESWNDAASLFKKAVTKDQWKTSAKTVRSPLGDLISREVLSQNYTQQVPGGPDGEYVIIQFKASYSNKKDAIETVTPMLDSDGQWRVSGYFIK